MTAESMSRVTAKLHSMLLLERSAPFEMLLSLARERSAWIENNIPRHLQSEIYSAAVSLIKKKKA